MEKQMKKAIMCSKSDEEKGGITMKRDLMRVVHAVKEMAEAGNVKMESLFEADMLENHSVDVLLEAHLNDRLNGLCFVYEDGTGLHREEFTVLDDMLSQIETNYEDEAKHKQIDMVKVVTCYTEIVAGISIPEEIVDMSFFLVNFLNGKKEKYKKWCRQDFKETINCLISSDGDEDVVSMMCSIALQLAGQKRSQVIYDEVKSLYELVKDKYWDHEQEMSEDERGQWDTVLEKLSTFNK